jgi:TRAP-type C4-dicarboxylate transport system permease large subunit
MAAWLTGMDLSPLGFLLFVNVLFPVLGCFQTRLLVGAGSHLATDGWCCQALIFVHLGVVLAVNMIIDWSRYPWCMLLFRSTRWRGSHLRE